MVWHINDIFYTCRGELPDFEKKPWNAKKLSVNVYLGGDDQLCFVFNVVGKKGVLDRYDIYGPNSKIPFMEHYIKIASNNRQWLENLILRTKAELKGKEKLEVVV